MSRPAADLVLYNASVITVDPAQPRAGMVAIKGNRILDVCTNEPPEVFRGTHTRLLDCQGKTIVPGFNDAHCHPRGFATSLLSVDFRPAAVRSIAEIQSLIRRQAEQIPRGEWIRAMFYSEFYLAEGRHPNRWDLDQAAPHHPVKLSHRSGHACAVNSLALKILDISVETPEPASAIIDRQPDTGEPNGLLLEMNSYVDKAIPPLSEAEMGRAFRIADREYLSHGITSLQDAGWNDSIGRWQMFKRLKERGELTPRLSMMIGADCIEEFQQNSLSTGSGDSQLRLGGVKIILHQTTGSLEPPQEELNQLVYRAHRSGFQLAFHTVEEITLEAAVIALEYLEYRIPGLQHRHRIEHCSVCPPHLLQRLKNTGTMVVTQPPFLYWSGERYLATVPEQELNYFYPIGSLLGSGIEVAASSDSPIVPLDPLTGIYAAVTRKAETGQDILPQEGISREEALKMYTLGAAYASFEEGSKGSVTPGKLADLVLLSDDPTSVQPDYIKDIEVIMTIVDGKIVWERE